MFNKQPLLQLLLFLASVHVLLATAQQGPRSLEENERNEGTWEEKISKCQHSEKASRNGSGGGNAIIDHPHCRNRLLSGNQSKKEEIQDASPPAGGWTLQLLLFLPTSCLLFHSSSLLPMQRAAYAHIMLLYPHPSSFAILSSRWTCVPPTHKALPRAILPSSCLAPPCGHTELELAWKFCIFMVY